MWQKGTLARVQTYPEVPLLDRAYNILGRDSGATLLCWYPCDVIRYVPPLLSVPVRHIGHLQTRTHRRHVSMMHMSHRPFRIRRGIRFHARTVSCHSDPYYHKQQLLQSASIHSSSHFHMIRAPYVSIPSHTAASDFPGLQERGPVTTALLHPNGRRHTCGCADRSTSDQSSSCLGPRPCVVSARVSEGAGGCASKRGVYV